MEEADDVNNTFQEINQSGK